MPGDRGDDAHRRCAGGGVRPPGERGGHRFRRSHRPGHRPPCHGARRARCTRGNAADRGRGVLRGPPGRREARDRGPKRTEPSRPHPARAAGPAGADDIGLDAIDWTSSTAPARRRPTKHPSPKKPNRRRHHDEDRRPDGRCRRSRTDGLAWNSRRAIAKPVAKRTRFTQEQVEAAIGFALLAYATYRLARPFIDALRRRELTATPSSSGSPVPLPSGGLARAEHTPLGSAHRGAPAASAHDGRLEGCAMRTDGSLSSNGGVSRRKFLRGGAAVAGGLVVASSVPAWARGMKPADTVLVNGASGPWTRRCRGPRRWRSATAGSSSWQGRRRARVHRRRHRGHRPPRTDGDARDPRRAHPPAVRRTHADGRVAELRPAHAAAVPRPDRAVPGGHRRPGARHLAHRRPVGRDRDGQPPRPARPGRARHRAADLRAEPGRPHRADEHARPRHRRHHRQHAGPAATERSTATRTVTPPACSTTARSAWSPVTSRRPRWRRTQRR